MCCNLVIFKAEESAYNEYGRLVEIIIIFTACAEYIRQNDMSTYCVASQSIPHSSVTYSSVD